MLQNQVVHKKDNVVASIFKIEVEVVAITTKKVIITLHHLFKEEVECNTPLP
ncbi:uncharacterized protein DS421_7g218020 [Arachis hypogaea]|nr:uncharacterized protein DS421_7g218020 [Arachis hypogaea]